MSAISLRRLSLPKWAFRSALASGSTLAQATEAALQRDGDFPLSAEITAIFAEGLVVGVE